jgi:protein-L-isoaspartate O-methyltransferase
MSSRHDQRSPLALLSERLREDLVTSLTQSGAIHSPFVRQAFLTVPREAFVPFFYTEDETSRKMAWVHVHADQTAPAGLSRGNVSRRTSRHKN